MPRGGSLGSLAGIKEVDKRLKFLRRWTLTASRAVPSREASVVAAAGTRTARLVFFDSELLPRPKTRLPLGQFEVCLFECRRCRWFSCEQSKQRHKRDEVSAVASPAACSLGQALAAPQSGVHSQ